MPLFDGEQLAWCRALDRLAYENPFSPRRPGLERELLGRAHVASGDADEMDVWQLGPERSNENVSLLRRRVIELLDRIAPCLERARQDELDLVATLVRFDLFYEFQPVLEELSRSTRPGLSRIEVPAYRAFCERLERHVPPEALRARLFGSSAHLFAIAFQLVRAFTFLQEAILGASKPSQRLRESVWNSIFTVDRRRYERALYDRMHQTSTLIAGGSGTGKELVARAIGSSRYIRFDDGERRFVEEIAGSFLPVNVAALSPGLVESELFGHKKGAFSGAVSDHRGFLEQCPAHGTLFLDEIGELAPELQVKLLRTLQSRTFNRVGDTRELSFVGKLVSATNRDLERARVEGRMREDFFYRIRADVVLTPSLSSQLSDRPADRALLVRTLAARLLPETEVDSFSEQALAVLQRPPLRDYPWPGNVRELEQCLRSILIRGHYHPPAPADAPGPFGSPPSAELGTPNRSSFDGTAPPPDAGLERPPLDEALLACELEADPLVDHYVALVYGQTRSYSETGRRLGLDWRTVKARLGE